MQTKAKKGALSGIRVIDMTRVLAGPYCTLLLGDMGAEIIKVEVPGHGDDSRKYPPFIDSESAYFMNLNRNKKSLTLNLKAPEGKTVLIDLVKRSDVLIENFRPGTLDDLGVGYATLKAVNPSLVYSSISGFGHSGPCKDLPGYDIIGQAMGGIMSVTGWPDGPPSRTGTAIADILAGLCACIGILSSLMAVRHGGGSNHRYGLSDAILIKDNHIAAAGGIAAAVAAVRAHAPGIAVEVEVTCFEELDQALAAGVEWIMLDNMPPARMAEAVRRVAGRARLEASGNVRLENIRAVAESGVDCISLGALTHSVVAFDISQRLLGLDGA